MCEPHAAVASERTSQLVLNLVAREGEGTRQTSASLAAEHPEKIVRELKHLQELSLPRTHEVLLRDLRPDSVSRILLKTYEQPPENFERLLERQGVGAKTLRALALISDLVYGQPMSFRDPAKFSFAHGGKDGHPYPVDRTNYDRSIEILREAVNRAKIGDKDRMNALRRLASVERLR